MDTMETILRRRSYRGRFEPTPVPREHLRAILEAGLAAPSGCNKQTVSLIAVDDPELLGKLRAVIDPPVGETAPAMICVLTRRIIAYRDRCFSVQDYAAAIENMLLAITALGYQSCWYEGHITDEDRIGDKMAHILNVPEGYELVCFLPVGVAAEEPAVPRKKPFAERAAFNAFPGERAMLERMEDFFAARLQGYDEHMLTKIGGAREFYPRTAALLPLQKGAEILDLGCGTGLELEAYYALDGRAAVTGIDLSGDMLAALRAKFPGRGLTLIQGSYFDVPLGENRFDAAVSVESLHHFPAARKLGLYRRLHAALKPGGFFVLTDYFAESEALEAEYFRNLKELREALGLPDDVFYHYDTPLTLTHETDVLRRAGFTRVECLKTWDATALLRAAY